MFYIQHIQNEDIYTLFNQKFFIIFELHNQIYKELNHSKTNIQNYYCNNVINKLIYYFLLFRIKVLLCILIKHLQLIV